MPWPDPPTPDEINAVLQKHGRLGPAGLDPQQFQMVGDIAVRRQSPLESQFDQSRHYADRMVSGLTGIRPDFDRIPKPVDPAAPSTLDNLRVMAATGPHNPVVNLAAGLIAGPSIQQYEKAQAAPAGSAERQGRMLAAALPIIGPAAADAGENIGEGIRTRDFGRAFEGAGQAVGLLAPVPAAGKAAGGPTVKQAARRLTQSETGAANIDLLTGGLAGVPPTPPKTSAITEALKKGLEAKLAEKQFITRQGGAAKAEALRDPKILSQVDENIAAGRPLWENEPLAPPSLEQHPLRRAFHETYLSSRAADPAQVFRDVPGLGKHLEQTYTAHGLQKAPQKINTGGTFSAVYDVGTATTGKLKGRDLVYRVSAEKDAPVPKGDWIATVHETHVTPEGVRVDVVDKLRPPTGKEATSGVFEADFQQLVKKVEAAGFDPTDLQRNRANAMYTKDGRLVVSDPGAVVPKQMKVDYELARFSNKPDVPKQREFFSQIARVGAGVGLPTLASLAGTPPDPPGRQSSRP